MTILNNFSPFLAIFLACICVQRHRNDILVLTFAANSVIASGGAVRRYMHEKTPKMMKKCSKWWIFESFDMNSYLLVQICHFCKCEYPLGCCAFDSIAAVDEGGST